MAIPGRWRGWLCVLGGFILHLSLGTTYTFGNMSPYVASYIRAYGSPSTIRYSDMVWVLALSATFHGASMAIGGLLYSRIGPRWTALLGGWFMSAGIFLTAVSIETSYFLCLFTYGAMVGFGIGLAYASPLACAMKWLPDHKGLVNGIVLAGFGGGAFIFDQVQTAYINPNNESPDLPLDTDPSEKYYSPSNQADILARTRFCFIILGVCYVVMQLIGAMLLTDPPHDQESLSLPVDVQEEEQSLLSYDHSGQQPSIPDEDLGSSPPQGVTQGGDDMHPKQVLRTCTFYTLWATFLFNGQAVVFIAAMYKVYGQTFIHDDSFLALLGALASVFNAGGRIMWGSLMDRFSYKTTMLCLCTSMMVFMMTLLATPYGGKPMFLVWICMIFLTFSGNFALFPTVTAKTFGTRYVAVNFGLIFTSQVVTGVLGAVLNSTISDMMGWPGMFFLIASFSFLSFLLTISFRAQGPDKKEI